METSLLADIKEVIVALAAAATAFAALRGVAVWKRETAWRENRDVARALMKGCLQVRDAFAHVRNSFVLTSEYPESFKSSADVTPELRYEWELYRYENRLKVLVDARSELEAAVAEAEVLWGSEIEKMMGEVRRCQALLGFNIRLHLKDIRSGGIEFENDPDRRAKIYNILNSLNDEELEFAKELRSALRGMLDIAERHLRR